jgi:putative intracellular protease/amidase
MATQRLKGRRVLMVIAPSDFRDEELLQPKARFEAEGAVVELASTTVDVARGMLGAEVTPDLELSAVDPHQYAAIALVGGPARRARLRRSAGATRAEHVPAGRPGRKKIGWGRAVEDPVPPASAVFRRYNLEL